MPGHQKGHLPPGFGTPEARRKGGLATKGLKRAATIAKEEAREQARRFITEHLDDILHAQLAKAKGTRYLVTRDDYGRYVPVSQATFNRMRRLGQDTSKVLEIYTREASTEAAKVLLDRALDQVPKPPDEVKVEGDITIRWANPDEDTE